MAAPRITPTVHKFVTSVWEAFRANSGLEPRLLDNLKVLDATQGNVKFELEIQKEHTVSPPSLLASPSSGHSSVKNRLGILHGGTIAGMVDLGGSLAIASKGLFATGVSTDLNVTYINSGGNIGDKVRAEAVCDKFGKTLAFTSVVFRNRKDELIAKGSHTKYVALAWKDEKNIVDQLQKA